MTPLEKTRLVCEVIRTICPVIMIGLQIAIITGMLLK